MKVQLFTETINGLTYLRGFSCDGDQEVPATLFTIRNWRDEYGNLCYRWDGTKPILDPISPTIEQKTAFANINIEIELAKLLYQSIKNNETWDQFKQRTIARYQELMK